MLEADETTDYVNCKQYNINVCCLKNNLPKLFFGEMIGVENAGAAIFANALKKFVEIHLNFPMAKFLAIALIWEKAMVLKVI